MSIELHCPQCGKVIRAPEDAGGKKGKCPYCKRSVYIPLPEDELDVIPLAPIDPDEEAREAKLRRESAQYAAAITNATESDTPGKPARPPSAHDAGPAEVIDFKKEALSFIVAMRDSKLDEADRIVEKLKRGGARARDHVQGIMVDEMPPAVENVPPPLARGFLQALLDRLA